MKNDCMRGGRRTRRDKSERMRGSEKNRKKASKGYVNFI